MAKRRPRINLSQPPAPRSAEIEKLFTSPEDVEQASGLQLVAVRLDAIQPDPDQPRSTFPRESLEELSASISQDGVIQPIELTEVRPNVYMIVHGERRWRAAKIAGLETIPAVVRRRDYDQLTRFVRQIVENIQREDLNDVDRAAGMIRLRDLLLLILRCLAVLLLAGCPSTEERGITQALADRLNKTVVGNPRNETVRMGPIVDKVQQTAVIKIRPEFVLYFFRRYQMGGVIQTAC